MKKSLPLLLTAASLCMSNCRTITPPRPSLLNLKEWTLEAIPNDIDKVGTIFAINRKGIQTYIHSMDIKQVEGQAKLTSIANNRNVSFGAMASFLNVPGFDPETSVQAKDSVRVHATFEVKKALLVRPNDDIAAAFHREKEKIISNIAFYGEERSSIYLITEVIKSPSVSIRFDKLVNVKSTFSSIINKWLKLNPSLSVNKNDSSGLEYDLQQPLVVFYKLRPIDLRLTAGRKGIGTKDTITDAVMSDKFLVAQELVFRKPAP